MLNGRLSAVNSGARRISCCHPRRYLAPAAPWPRLNSDERRAACISGKKRGGSQWRKEIVGGLIAAHAFLVFLHVPRGATWRDTAWSPYASSREIPFAEAAWSTRKSVLYRRKVQHTLETERVKSSGRNSVPREETGMNNLNERMGTVWHID